MFSVKEYFNNPSFELTIYFQIFFMFLFFMSRINALTATTKFNIVFYAIVGIVSGLLFLINFILMNKCLKAWKLLK